MPGVGRVAAPVAQDPASRLPGRGGHFHCLSDRRIARILSVLCDFARKFEDRGRSDRGHARLRSEHDQLRRSTTRSIHQRHRHEAYRPHWHLGRPHRHSGRPHRHFGQLQQHPGRAHQHSARPRRHPGWLRWHLVRLHWHGPSPGGRPTTAVATNGPQSAAPRPRLRAGVLPVTRTPSVPDQRPSHQPTSPGCPRAGGWGTGSCWFEARGQRVRTSRAGTPGGRGGWTDRPRRGRRPARATGGRRTTRPGRPGGPHRTGHPGPPPPP